MNRLRKLLVAVTTSSALAACGGSSGGAPATGSTPPASMTRGTITARSASSITVNGVVLQTGSASVRISGAAASPAALGNGMVVTARGGFDDRTGEAVEIETEHAVEGPVDDKGTDFLVVGGQRVHVDDSTEFGAGRPGRMADLSVGDVVAVSGVADDRGGVRASRVDDSPRQGGPTSDDDDFDIQGFVSNVVTGASFELRITPDASERWLVTTTGVTLPAGFRDGARVEVHSLTVPVAGTPPLLGTIAASSVELEDSLDRSGEDGEVEREGIVTSGTSAAFVIDGTTVVTNAATVWRLGLPEDLVPGVKVEAEGQVDGAGVLQAHKVSFRAGVRLVGSLADVSWDGTSGTATILGVPVQLPSFARYDVTPANGQRVELRGNPGASGAGVVALRLGDASGGGGGDRVFVRAVVTAKSNATESAPSFTILGFAVSSAGASFRGTADEALTAQAFYAAVEVGRTVVKVRAASAADVSGTAFAAEELELEGDE